MYAYSGNKTLADIINHLALLINNMITGNAQFNFHKISSDEPKVQLLTIHASKGLQFKIVFLVGGFTKRKPPSYFTYHSKGSKIFDLLKDPQSKMLHHIEEDNEEARLFYVALTRAKERLYVPKFTPTKRSASKAGIVGSKLATILETIQGDPIVKKVIFSEQNIIPQKNTIQKKSACSKTPSVARFLIKDAFHFLDRRLIVESYTTIKNAKGINHHKTMQIVDGDRKIYLFDEVMESIT
jgi:ATP-dependent exoDNAse (exonuclease V) beta subunit